MPVDNVRVTAQLLARILIAKVEDHDRLTAILERVPLVQDDPEWRCRSWIASALEAIDKDGKAVGTSNLNWSELNKPEGVTWLRRLLLGDISREIFRVPGLHGTCLRTKRPWLRSDCSDCWCALSFVRCSRMPMRLVYRSVNQNSPHHFCLVTSMSSSAEYVSRKRGRSSCQPVLMILPYQAEVYSQ